MKRLFFVFVLFTILFCMTSTSFALSDPDYKEMMRTSAEFRDADNRLTEAYKRAKSCLSWGDFEQLKHEQRKWIKDRDAQAARYVSQGYSKDQAYARCDRERTVEIENIINQGSIRTNGGVSSYPSVSQDERGGHRGIEDARLRRQREIEENVPPYPLDSSALEFRITLNEMRTSTGSRSFYNFCTLVCKVDDITVYDMVINRGNMRPNIKFPIRMKFGQAASFDIIGYGRILEVVLKTSAGISTSTF